MHALVRYVVLSGLVMALTSCSPDPPRVRVLNQRTQITDVQLKRSSGNTYNLNDVGPSSATGYIEVDPSSYEVDTKIEGVSASATTFFTADEDQSYTVVVINSDPPTVRMDKP